MGLKVDGLSSFNKGLVPTFRNPSNKKIIHQLDYIYLSENLLMLDLNCFGKLFSSCSVLISEARTFVP